MPTDTEPGYRVEASIFAGVSAVLLAVRLFATTRVGFGDSEALYAAYALHPQPAYLDHPGMIGIVARAIGGGTSPSPERAHLITSLLATLVPGIMALACRAAGARWRNAFVAGIVVALVPETAVGLFGMTPDLLLALLWSGTLALAALALQAPAGGPRASFAFAGAGLFAGVAATSKITGTLLLGALVITYLSRPARTHARTIAPWVGIAAGLVALWPVLAFESHSGWPMVAHRLIDTQSGAGLSLRNLGAFVGGQIAYLSPLILALVYLGARAAWRDRADAVGTLLLTTSALPALALGVLCLWSRVAEPHWFAPALLALAPALARTSHGPSRRLVIASSANTALFVGILYGWALVPAAIALAPTRYYDARVDITNELFGWPATVDVVRDEVAAQFIPGLDGVVVVGPNWVICAQLDAELRGDIPVGCDSPVRDDFDGWWPRERWHNAESIIWVTDDRYGPPPELPLHVLLSFRKVRVLRAHRVVRTFTVAVFSRRAAS